MRERGILFSAPMVRAILAGTKTQTRRIAKVNDHDCKPGFITPNAGFVPRRIEDHAAYCPHGQPGDRLWVREAFADLRFTGIEHRPDPRGKLQRYAYAADTPPGTYGDEIRKEYGIKWKPSIHMPREASRITLEITEVRVERLNKISEEDARAEGGMPVGVETGQVLESGAPIEQPSYLLGFESLWESINGPGSWAANPWVWVITFKRLP